MNIHQLNLNSDSFSRSSNLVIGSGNSAVLVTKSSDQENREKPPFLNNKANLRDLIAATGLVILLKLDWNRRFFSPYDLEIWWMTSKNYRAPLLHYIKLCASSQTPRWIQTGVTVRKRSIRVKIGDFFAPCDLENWWMSLKNNRAPLLCYIKLCASFQNHQWIQTGVTVRKRSIQVKIGEFLSHVTLKFDG